MADNTRLRRTRLLIPTLILALMVTATIVATAGAAEPATTTPSTKQIKVKQALAPVVEDPSLPRVFLIGDSISIGYTVTTRELLHGKANLLRARENSNDTNNGIKMMDAWLGSGKWDVIHFNFGLHDLKYVADEQAKDEKKRRQNVPVEQYEKNLEAIVLRLKKTGAKLIWCTTTPIPPGGTGDRVAGDEVRYNEAAARVMKKYDIPTDDLCAFVREHQAEWQLPGNVHYTDEGYKALATQVTASIEKSLKE